MDKYDYHQAVKNDCVSFIKDRMQWGLSMDELRGILAGDDDKFSELYNDAWIDDSVTGNASGSYTFSTWKAEENVCHNMDLFHEAMDEFGLDANRMMGA